MSKKLFIVESPNKIKTLNKFLSDDYIVTASVGHVTEIPKKGINVDVKNGFEATYQVIRGKGDVVKKIKDLASKCEEVILATDRDREGEAIAWHIYNLLPKRDQAKCCRVSYDAVTKSAVQEALKHPRKIDYDQVDAQKARQILDRLIGYKVSPVLWYKAHISGSSAGRVQSIALKLVCDRQKEIDAFKPTDYWFVDALLKCDKGEFWAKVVTKNKDNRYLDEKVATDDFAKLKDGRYKVSDITKKERLVNPHPPFDTNSLMSACSSLFGWSVAKSKVVAQKIYEQGLVTYIRTDSFSIADEALDEVRGLIKTASSSEYLPKKPNVYHKKSGASAQEAHECIRPTHINDKGTDIGDSDERKMYELIRKRFIACQMTPMVVDTVKYTVKTNTKHTLIAKGQAIKFDGWFKVYTYSKTKEEILPVVAEKEELQLKDIKKTKHSTKPPARYNEASIGDQMEKEGVGRPATRAGIITAIQKKGYVEKEKGKGKKGMVATPLGMQIYDYLDPHFSDFFMDIKYTSALEDDLDDIAKGEKTFLDVVSGVYSNLQAHIKDAGDEPVENKNESMGEKCTACDDGEIMKKNGRFGEFFACSKYPKCKTIYVQAEDGKFSVKKKKPVKKVGRKCPECEKKGRDGELLERKNKKDGNVFIGCSKYPSCRYSESVEKKENG